MDDEQVQIASVTFEDILRTSLPCPADHLPWYIPKRFWHSLIATDRIPSCESAPLDAIKDTGRQDNGEQGPAQLTRDILLRCTGALVRLHNIRHIVVVSRNGGTVRRLLQLTNASRPARLLVLTDRISTVEELLGAPSGEGNLTIVRYGRAALVGAGELAKLPASYNIESDEDIIAGIGKPAGMKLSPEERYELKLEKLFQSARMIVDQQEQDGAPRTDDGRKLLFLYPDRNFTFVLASFVRMGP
ncbi:hypothetical protein ZHAS_00013119 [Anopheles sinensis]|uniref:Uncharacterized protein n=1 Tax=Anopheles sinensis TaxID=74873 RepID=A0A084W4I3_ANOSI|nr:hypothetical protein ZHAS_00013119 [Anopheles sinensis]